MKKETTASRLKKIMSENNLRQIDILNKTVPYCEKYEVKMNKSDISQYCSGKTEPNQEKLFILGMALNVNEAWLMGFDVPMERSTPEGFKRWADQYNATHEQFMLSKKETKLVKSYRFLDSHGKDIVDTVLDKEYERCVSASSAKIKSFSEQVLNSDNNKKEKLKDLVARSGKLLPKDDMNLLEDILDGLYEDKE